MSNGILKQTTTSAGKDVLAGELATFRHFIRFWLDRNIGAMSDKAPTHIIRCVAPHGQAVNIGVAWERSISRGASAGGVMFSLSFSDPEFGEEPIYASAFPEVPGTWGVQLERKRRPEGTTQPQSGEAAANGPASGAAMGGDSSPF